MFVGRGTLLAQIHEAAAQERGKFDLKGSLGSGKTAIVRRLDEEAHGFRRVLVNMEEFNPENQGEMGDSASVGAVQGSFRQFSRLLIGLLGRTCPDDVAKHFEREVTEAYNSEIAGRRVFSLEQAMDETQGALTPKQLADAWRDSAGAVADAFVSHWNAAEEDKGRLLLLDNVDEIADQELGVFLGDLLPRLNRTVVVLTRQPDGPFPSLPATKPDGLETLDVPNFTEAEVSDYLEEKAPGRVSSDLARNVYRITDGHPGTVSVVYDLLWGSGVGNQSDAEDELLGLPTQASEKVALLVERLVKRLDDPAMSKALQAATVPRRFDAELLKVLVAPMSDDDLRRVFETIALCPFIEDVTPPDDLPEKSLLRIHPHVRNGLLDRMLRLERDHFYALHERAAKYHERLLLGKGATGASFPYGEAFVYEDPDWQRHKREWLYHCGYAQHDETRQLAVLQGARVFLEAFWWWGNYVHFDFCDQLVADLGHMVERRRAHRDKSSWDELEVLHDALVSFLQAYPPRSGKRKDADWTTVYDALLQIEDACGLADRNKAMSDDKRKVAALLDVFLAHTWRYQAVHMRQANECYKDAARAFRQLKEDWSAAWVYFEQAELCLEQDHVDGELRNFWLQAANIVQQQASGDGDGSADDGDESDQPDEELAANLHRLRGDVCWSHGDTARAATWYRRAVLHAYLFHAVGGPPDEYTLQFYVDIRARALNRLLELWATNERQEDALNCAEELVRVRTDTSLDEEAPTRAELEARLAERTPVKLAHALFPPGPEVSDLKKENSPFLRELRRRRKELDTDSTALDLHDQQWP
jgi:hypothetical protein